MIQHSFYWNNDIDRILFLMKHLTLTHIVVCYTLDNYLQLCSDNSIFMHELRGKAESFDIMMVSFLYTK